LKAFPDPHIKDETRQGMDLRDYFAGQELAGAIAHGLFNTEKATKDYAVYLANVAYWYADEMMKARNETNEQV